MKARMTFALAAGMALNALAWSSSTTWQWDDAGRAGIYAEATSVSAPNATAFGPRLCNAASGNASQGTMLEARVFGWVTLTGLVLEKHGIILILR